MGLYEDLNGEVNKIVKEGWTLRDGQVVPEPRDLKYANDGVWLDAVCLYADLADSTTLVTKANARDAAEVFKTYLLCAAKIIRDKGGAITAYDGDRVMSVFIGERMRSRAVIAALGINYAVNGIIKPAFASRQLGGYSIAHGVGIDVGKILVARTGFRNADDLVWIGPAANCAAKLSSLRSDGIPLWITDSVHDQLAADAKLNNGESMWQKRTWNTYNRTVYCSNFHWKN